MMIFEFHLISIHSNISYAPKIYIHVYVLLDFDIFLIFFLSRNTFHKMTKAKFYKIHQQCDSENEWKNWFSERRLWIILVQIEIDNKMFKEKKVIRHQNNFIHLERWKFSTVKKFFMFFFVVYLLKLWNVNCTNRMLNRCKIKGSVFTVFFCNRIFNTAQAIFLPFTAIFHPKFKWKTSSCKIFLLAKDRK